MYKSTDLIIDAEYYEYELCISKHPLKIGTLTYRDTNFGCIISGSVVGIVTTTMRIFCYYTLLHHLIRYREADTIVWGGTEEVNASEFKFRDFSVSKGNFDRTVSRLIIGHFIVRLLFKQESTLLGNVTGTCALRALYHYKKSMMGIQGTCMLNLCTNKKLWTICFWFYRVN